MYSPSVASSDSMMSRKITFVNTSVIWRGLPSPAATVWILLNASKNAAVCQKVEVQDSERCSQENGEKGRQTVIYMVMKPKPMKAVVYPHLEPCGRFPSDKIKHKTSNPR